MEIISSAASTATSTAASVVSASAKLLGYAGTIAVAGAIVALVILVIWQIKEKLFGGKNGK